MESGRLPVPMPDVIHQSVEDGAVLLSPTDEVYFGLNEVGAVIWSLLPPASQTFEELCDNVAARYPGVQREILEQDIRELFVELAAQQLISFDPLLTSGSDERRSGRA